MTGENEYQITLMDLEIDLNNQHTKLRRAVTKLHETMSMSLYLEGMYRERAERETEEWRAILWERMRAYDAMTNEMNQFIDKYANELGNPNKRTVTAYDLVKAQTAAF